MTAVEGERIHVLSVAPDGEIGEEQAAVLDRGGFSVDARTDPAAVLDHVDERVDCIVSTYQLDGTDGVALLRSVREEHPDLPFVLVAIDGDEAVASEAIRAGVTDYVPVDGAVTTDLADRVANAVESHRAAGGESPEVYERISDAFYAVDEEFRFTYVNEYAEELLQADAEELIGERLWDEYPEAVETDAYDAFHEALETQQPTGYELYFDPLDFWVEARVYPSETGLSVYFRDVTERRKRERAMRDAYEIIADPDRSFREQADALLKVVRDAIGMEYGTLSRVREEADEYIFEMIAAPEGSDLQAGDSTPLSSLPNCEHVVETERTFVVRDVEEEAPELADPEWGIASYLGAPVTVGGEVYGTFCFYGMETRAEEFSDWEVTFVELLSNWVEHELERERTNDRLSALNNLNAIARDINQALIRQSTQEEIEQVVCERLAASDSYEFAWIGTVDESSQEVVPSTTVNTGGYLDEVTITADESATGQGPTGTAIRTGTTQIVRNVDDAAEYGPWRDHARERDINATAAIPIAYDDQVYGVLNVYTTRQDGFSGEEQAVVSQLGDIIGLAIAATEREQRLRENERRYRTLAENIPKGTVMLFDTDLRFQTVAGSIYDQVALDPGDFRGNRVSEVEGLPTELGEQLEQAYQAALDGESRDTQIEYESWTFDVQVIPIRDDAGSVTAGMSLVQDVTERQLLERTYRDIFEQVADGLVVHDPDTGEILDVNEQFCEMSGYDREEIIGGSVGLMTPPGDEYTVEEARRRVQQARDEGPQLFEWRNQRADGTTYPVEVHLAAVRIEGEERVLASVRDVTQRKERERQLEYERERLEFFNRLVRHNLLNDLNAVRAHADFLGRYIDPEADEHLDVVQERTGDMIDLITTLRSLMQVVVEEEDHELEAVDLGAVLQDEVEQARQSSDRAEFVVRGADDVGPVVADDLLGEMFENLLTNAVQHNDKETPRVTIDVEAGDETATVRVADNGPGVPEEVRDDLFEKGEKDFGSSGTGFGLYLVREIVEGYGGTIDIEDDPSGAVFSIELPLA